MPDDLRLEPYEGRWADDDPDANFKREVAEYTRNDPLPTLQQLSANTGIPVGALARYVLVKWAAQGHEALLALGPTMVERLWAEVERAEASGTDEARLTAYARVSEMLAWLRLPLTPEDGPPSR